MPKTPEEISMAEFQTAVQAYLDIADRTSVLDPRIVMAGHFQVAPSTVTRWAKGVARPHPLIRAQILKWIEEQT